jgi:hypothetical protein
MKIIFHSLEAARIFHAFAEEMERSAREVAAMQLAWANTLAAVVAAAEAPEQKQDETGNVAIPFAVDPESRAARSVLEDCLDAEKRVLWPYDFSIVED